MRALTHPTPLGPLTLVADGGQLTQLRFDAAGDDSRAGVPAAPDADDRVLGAAARQLDEYFAGQRQAFDLPLALPGTDFSRRVWQALSEIPYGTTTTYGTLAAHVCAETGPHAARAVASAVARTPVPIIVPCHRVIGADGALRGYIGGLPRKRALLDLEAGRPSLAVDQPVAVSV